MNACPFCEKAFASLHSTFGHSEIFTCEECRNPLLVYREGNHYTVSPMPGLRDVRDEAPPQSVGGEIIDALRAENYVLPVLPTIAQQIGDAISETGVWEEELFEMVSSDPVVTARMMDVANGAVYGGLDPVEDIASACARMGSDTVMATLTDLAKGPVFYTQDLDLARAIHDHWRHSLFTAHCAREIAAVRNEPNPDSYFVAGMLHDIGKYLLYSLFAENTSEAVKMVRESPTLMLETVQRFHTLVGLVLTQRWQLPPAVCVAAFCHHEPERAPDETYRISTHIVSLANAMAHRSGHGAHEPVETSLLSHPSNGVLELSDIRIAAIRIDIQDRLERTIENVVPSHFG